MNFARHQEQAERAGRRLLWLHGLATGAVVLAVNAVATLLWQLAFGATLPPRGFHVTNTAVVLLLVVGGAWLETTRLREDGALIARRLGAAALDTIADPLHRRLQNLLEELAIAARIGVPRAFVLEDEPTINALTAGLDRNHAVVVVTRGALSRLNRDELQGVLAHEVSHIVNGDVRLNTRLVAMNHGLELVALFGRAMLARPLSQARDGRIGVLTGLAAVPLLLLGATLAVVGSIGELAARAIKAGVGRQREFFADAQAVAFTRSRDGLGGALRKIAGLARRLEAEAAAQGGARGRDPRRDAALRHPYWHNVSHLLLVGPTRSRRWFATHPPLRDRVHRLYGRHMDPLEPRPLLDAQRVEPELPAFEFSRGEAAAGADNADRADNADDADDADIAAIAAIADVACAAAHLQAAQPSPASGRSRPPSHPSHPQGEPDWPAPMRLVQATRDPAGAAALVVALLHDERSPPPRWDAGWASAAGRYGPLRTAVAALPEASLRSLRWPLIELAVARLRPLSLPSRETLLATAREGVVADGRVTLREWIYYGLLRLRLAPRPAGTRLPVLAGPIDARSIRVLFALVAHAAQVREAKADRAANAAIRMLDLVPIGGSAGPLTLDALERAVLRVARLPPLARPLLIRQLVAMLPPDADASVRDFLRVLCIAIDCPPPELPPRSHETRRLAHGVEA